MGGCPKQGLRIMSLRVATIGRFAILGLGLGLALNMPARADEHPVYMPTKDVAVVYALTRAAPGAPTEAHMYYSAASSRMRLDAPGQRGYVIIDRAKNQMMLVMSDQHLFMETPLNADMASGFLLNDQMKFKRLGTDKVAGQSCTQWEVQSARANGTVCVTDDGVLLAGRGQDKQGGVGALQATTVSYKPQPASLFSPPADYHRVPMPQMAPGQGNGPQGNAPVGNAPMGAEPQTK